MSPGIRMLLTATADFVGALGTAVTAAMVHEGQVVLPGKGVWILGIIMGAMAFWSHIKASLTQPAPAGPNPASGPGGGGG